MKRSTRLKNRPKDEGGEYNLTYTGNKAFMYVIVDIIFY